MGDLVFSQVNQTTSLGKHKLTILIVVHSCFSKIQISLLFWYRLTRVVPDKGPLNGCVCTHTLNGPFVRDYPGEPVPEK